MANRFSYGAWDLSFLIQGQKGGDIFSVTDWFGKYAGVVEETLVGREVDFCDPGVNTRGVLPDGTLNGDGVDDAYACPQDYYGGVWGSQEASIFDASYIKLRELRIGYEMPVSWVRWMGFNGGNFSLIGRNLLLLTDIPHIDPETAFDASNVQGIEFGQFPSVRSFGFSLTLW
jgi:hypothetical protein